MELMQEVKGYSDSREEEEEEEAAEIIATTGEESSRLRQQDAAANWINQERKQVDFVELSLGSNREEGSSKEEERVEKEHMFDKVVTPSDVGKLNRLVIPKQYAEKYFPLDSSSNEKGLLLNFEDRNGKLWRFRYSYWNSSQSYVMTKGWSRFVKEKKLDAGDIVSFHRGLGELHRHRLFIDWRRRPDHVPHPSASLIASAAPFFLPNHYNYNIACGSLYSLPSPPPTSSTPRYRAHFHRPLNYSTTAFHQPQYRGDHLNSGSAGSLYYLTSPPAPSVSTGDQQDRGNILPMIIDSVPVAHHHHHHRHHHHNRGGTGTGTVITAAASNNASTTGKRLRLFGVNMECASSPASAPHVAMPNPLPSSSLQRLSLPHQDPLSSSATFGDQRGATSVLFDLDPSSQYRQ